LNHTSLRKNFATCSSLPHWPNAGQPVILRVLRGCYAKRTSSSPRGTKAGLLASRALSDFSYSCYLSDLAVDVAYQRRGIGKRLIEETRANAGPEATLVLLSAPAAESYYPRIGMKKHESCWIVPRRK
jgi:ribosomal protein S18 acetylase RimI-like enzyme